MHEEDFEDEEHDYGPSRSEQRREALAVLDLAMKLVGESDARLQQIPMDEDLLALVIASKKITSQIARKRQIHYLAKQMRRQDDEALQLIRAALDHDKAEGRREAQALHEVEYWRDKLVDDGDEALSELLANHPHADRQHLRQLARNAHQERLKNKPPHAYRELFRELRTLLSAPDDAAHD
ncbi:MAG TPA: ribosome biogenesis factor YjgA [Arenimonas sp.]|uniref:ribosome biogenesis factor YjgA n=1 Tax=Arenimonas sp. TaxID=1872635 RepID=UPI002D7ED705|nr:ribosome biogenesis factor YjgA [Arenimonas sp.]HEU0152833.1 ribosome biogenesis factor YjgA [Arenimonas sp.]